MRDLISKGLLTAAAATSVLSLSGGYAQAADSEGLAARSPGLLSGNTIQVPLDIPVNLCGNTVNPVGLADPAFGNACANESDSLNSVSQEASSSKSGVPGRPTAFAPGAGEAHAPYDGYAHDVQFTPGGEDPYSSSVSQVPYPADTGADGVATGSPGVVSGNLVQAPVEVPLNACGNSLDVIGALSPAFGNECANDPMPPDVPEPWTPPVEDRTVVPPAVAPPVHRTPEPMLPVATPDLPVQLAATGSDENLFIAAMSAVLLFGGGILYRRSTRQLRI